MKRLVCLFFLTLICGTVYAQDTVSVYRYKYKVLKNNYSGSKEIAGKEYKSGDIISLIEPSTFDLQRIGKGKQSKERVRNKYGLFVIDSLYRLAQNDREAIRNIKSSNVSKPSGILKSTDSTLYRFTGKIASVFSSQIKSITECGTIEFKRNGLKVVVKNTSDIDDMFVDIIWTKDGLCMSALSFSRDFANSKVIYPGESIECVINEFVAGEKLFVVCTPWPVEYNSINLNQAKEQDMTYDIDIPLTIVPIEVM